MSFGFSFTLPMFGEGWGGLSQDPHANGHGARETFMLAGGARAMIVGVSKVNPNSATLRVPPVGIGAAYANLRGAVIAENRLCKTLMPTWSTSR
jgi:hypothetical protein